MDDPEWQRFRRRNLPHWEVRGGTYFVTIRLEGSLPAAVAQAWAEERKQLREQAQLGAVPLAERIRGERVLAAKFDDQLDRSQSGPRFLTKPPIAQLMIDALRFYEPQRYALIAYVVMPNHAHIVLTPADREAGLPPWGLDRIFQSLKGYTAKSGNQMLSRSGQFWQREYYDHLIRDDDELAWYVNYTLHNPVTAGLCNDLLDWPWSNAAEVYGADVEDALQRQDSDTVP